MAEDQQKPQDTPETSGETQTATEAATEAAEAPTDVTETAAEAAEAPETTETAEAEPAAEPAAEADVEGDGASRLIEEAVEAAAEELTVPTAEDAGVTGQPDEDVPVSIDSVDELAGRIGYTGEITGRVVTLEELAEAEAEEEEAAQSYDELRALIDKTLTEVSEQEIVKGRVVSVGDKEVVVDFGFKSDGIVSKNEFDRELAPGDEVEVYLEYLEDRQGQPVISKTKADKVRRWQRIEEIFENEEVIEGTIVRRIKGGMIVELDVGQVEAFLPGSQIDVRPVRDFDAYLDKRMEFKIVKLNPANENIVVSHKALIEKELHAQREKILSTMEPGQVLEGTVKNITDFGVFIDLGGVDGLLHITDLSWGRVSHPSELVDLDEKLNVVVLDYDKERQRISLGLKQLQPHPWENIGEKFHEGDVVEGKVVSITDYGAFVELEKGIEGLVHISEMSWTEHIKHPSQKVALGQIVPVKILNIDHEGKKISLGMKQLEPDPWVGISDRYPPGTVLRGKVRNITNFGVFVEIEPGIDGLVHISDLSWTKKIRHPSEVAKKGQDMDVVILNIDEKERRISLGHKQIQTNPWNDLANVYSVGTDHEVRIKKVADKGLVVELPMEVEAFIPASELKHSHNFQDFYEEGGTIGVRVIRFDVNQKEIILSETAKERAAAHAERTREQRERREEEARQRREISEFQQKATTGPTTLGELSGLADLKAQLEAAEAEAVQAETEETASEAEGEKPVSATESGESVAEIEATEAAAEEAEEALAEAEEAADEAADDEAADDEAADDEAEKTA
ncbi:30S ribosomal protein S1 [Rhodothermaceae bacterium RA]|nr:30S ribosomal protein S1 [Rhodothermaceae bacterium RA]